MASSSLHRLGALAKTALGAAVIAIGSIGLTAGQAEALVVTVEVGGSTFEVTTFTGLYNDNIGKFETAANGGVMPWWDDEQLALDLAETVGNAFGATNGPFGPFFAYDFVDPSIFVAVGSSFGSVVAITGATNVVSSETWAQATEVPGPLPALGAAAAFGFSRKLRKRIKDSESSFSSTYTL